MVSNIGGNPLSAQMQRPDSSKMASSLFSKLDTKNQGYIEKGDLQSAFDQIASSGNSATTASVDDVFKTLDGNGDGKVTEQDMSDSLKKLTQQFESQFNSMRMQGMGGMQGMSGGVTRDQLGDMVDGIGATDGRRADQMANLAANFDTADSNGDGKVSPQEARAFNQVSQANSLTSSASDAAAILSGAENSDAGVMVRIMQLVRAYGGAEQTTDQTEAVSTLSTVA
jgi:hypothetical protein